MTHTRSKRWLWPVLVAVASLSLALGATPLQAGAADVPGSIYARVAQQEVLMSNWPAGSQLDVVIDGALFNVTVAGDSSAAVQNVPLQPGTTITVDVTEGAGLGLHNEMAVSPLAVTWVDYANDTVYGEALPSVADPAAPDTLVQVCTGWWVGGSTGGSCRWVTATPTVPTTADYGQGLATWIADFGHTASNPQGGTEPAVDLRPYWMGIEAGQLSVPLGVSEVRTMNSPAQYPYLDVQFRSDWDPPASGDVVALGFDEGTDVQYTLYHDGQLACSQRSTVQPPGDDPDGMYRWLSWAPYDQWVDGCNPAVGDRLVAAGRYRTQPLSKELVIVTPRDSDGVTGVDLDVAADLVSGTVPAGFDVEVGAWDGPSVQVLVPDGVTAFTADFSTSDPPYDVQPWSWFGVQVLDPDGDLVDTQLRGMPLVFSVDPDTGLVGGQVVQLSGEAFRPGTAVAMQGAGFIGGLDPSTAMELMVGPDGAFSVPYRVHQFITVPTGPEHEEFVTVDCGAPGDAGTCFLVVMNDPDWAQTDTTFLPAEVTLTVQPTATVVKASGRLTIAGTVGCTTSDSVTIDGTVTQRIGRKALATGSFSVVAACVGGKWTASVTPSGSVPFGTGTAEVLATATLMAGNWDVTASITQLVSIRAAKK